ncbi:MAG: FimV family protein [Gammaproteobacteria bacterium]
MCKAALLLMAIVAAPVQAIGLGAIEVRSYLNQPFDARIPITAGRDESLADLRVALAAQAQFDKAGLQRTAALMNLKFEIARDGRRGFVHVTSQAAMREPALDFLVEISGSRTRLVERYQVALDPQRP